MAGRGRPSKDALSCAAAEAKSQGQSYGHYMEAQQKKEVHVEQTDGVERQKVSDRIHAQKMSVRAYGHHMAALKEIQDEISEHDKSIDEEKKLADVHLANIKEHQQAIKALQEELKEEKEFIKAHEP
ncbi:MAG: hypothetical protein IKP29_07710 [Pseudobutyrivibrio sp.]|nr:hypothetical protein [Pseudobutyrivibrio sp.]